MPLRYIIISLALHVVLLFSLNHFVEEQKPPKDDKPLIARILTKEIPPPPTPAEETPTLPPKTKPQKSTVPHESSVPNESSVRQKSSIAKETQKQAAPSRPAVTTAKINHLPSKASPPVEVEKGPQRTQSKEQPGKSAKSKLPRQENPHQENPHQKNLLQENPLQENPPLNESGRQPTAADRLFNRDFISGEARSYVYSHPSKTQVRPKPGANDTDISFDVDDMKYHNYLLRLRDSIESVWTYPRQAGRKGIYGDLFIKFTINKDGTLAAIDVSRTSGHRILDEAAMDALRRAFPFWPLPNEWEMETFTITGHFIYTLQVSAPQ